MTLERRIYWNNNLSLKQARITKSYYELCQIFNFMSYIVMHGPETLSSFGHKIWNIFKAELKSDSNGIRTHNHFFRKRTLNHLLNWLSVHLRTKLLWVQIPLLSFKLQIWRLLWVRSSLTLRETIKCRFTLNLVRKMIITYS